MTAANSDNQLFYQILSLVGTEVDVGLISTAGKLRGRIINAMFDSFLVDSNGKIQVVSFKDLLYLNPCLSS